MYKKNTKNLHEKQIKTYLSLKDIAFLKITLRVLFIYDLSQYNTPFETQKVKIILFK